MNDLKEFQRELVAGLKTQLVQPLREDLAKLASRQLDLEQHVASNGRTGGSALSDYPGIAVLKQVLDDPRIKAVADGAPSSGKLTFDLPVRQMKALISGLASDSPPRYPTPATRGPIVPDAFRPISLLELLMEQAIPVTTNSYEYVRLTGGVEGAEVQLNEGDEKQQTTLEPDLAESKIATIAHWTQASRQVLADNSQLGDVIRSVLLQGVWSKAERLLLNGNGTTDIIRGILPRAVTFTATGDSPVDRIGEAVAAQQAAGYLASAVILHPLTWFALRSERATPGGEYLAGSWANPSPPVAWNVPVVTTPAMTPDEAVIIDTNRVRLLDRQQASVLISSEDRDNFVRNLLTLLAEARYGLAVFDDASILSVDVSVDSP
jgi:hypothetical protein